MTVERVIPSARHNDLSPKRFRRKPHLRRFVRIIQSAIPKFLSYKRIWRIHSLRGVRDGLCGLFSHPNIKRCAADCSGESGVMPIIRSSRAEMLGISCFTKFTLCRLCGRPCGTYRGEECARPAFRVGVDGLSAIVRAIDRLHQRHRDRQSDLAMTQNDANDALYWTTTGHRAGGSLG